MAQRHVGLDRRYVFLHGVATLIRSQLLGAERDAAEGGMTHEGLDLSYLGVRTVWFNDLGTSLLYSLQTLHLHAYR